MEIPPGPTERQQHTLISKDEKQERNKKVNSSFTLKYIDTIKPKSAYKLPLPSCSSFPNCIMGQMFGFYTYELGVRVVK